MRTHTTIDVAPLNARPRLGEALREMRASEQAMPARLRLSVWPLVILLAALLVLFVGGAVALGPDVLFDVDGSFDTGMAGILALSSLLPLSALGGIVITLRLYVTTAVRRWRLARFSAANGWSYAPWSPTAPRSGMYFTRGTERAVRDSIHAPERDATFGAFTAREATQGSASVVTTQFATVRLPRALPHIVLDARRNDSLTGRSNLPLDPTRDQRLDFEGDFPRHFRVWAPDGYEADALYLFTPDVMAILIDHARDYDIEIVDDRMIFTSQNRAVTTDPVVWTSLIAAIDALAPKIEAWGRWCDDRMHTGVRPGEPAAFAAARRASVASRGRRLREKFPWIWFIIGMVGLGFWLYGLIADGVAWLSSLG